MKTLVTVFALMLTGCGTTTAVKYAVPQSPSITVVRDSGWIGSGCDIVVIIDKRNVAVLAPGKSHTEYLPIGKYSLNFGFPVGSICDKIGSDGIHLNMGRVLFVDSPIVFRYGSDAMSGQFLQQLQ